MLYVYRNTHVFAISMIQNFKDKDTRQFFQGACIPRFDSFSDQATRRLTVLNRATTPRDLVMLRNNRFELLRGDRDGQYSIRINRQWRICFRWTNEGPRDVQIVDYQ